MKIKHLFIFIIIALFFCKGSNPPPAKIVQKDVSEMIFANAKTKAAKEYSIQTGIFCNLGELFVKEGDEVQAKQKLLLCDGVPFYSPIDGQVTEINYFINENIPPGNPIVKISNKKDMYLLAYLDQASALKIKPKMKAYLTGEELGDKKIETEVESVFSKKENFLAKLKFLSDPGTILPGMNFDVAIELNTKHNIPVIAIGSVTQNKIRLCRGKENLESELKPINSEWAEIVSPEGITEGFEVCM